MTDYNFKRGIATRFQYWCHDDLKKSELEEYISYVLSKLGDEMKQSIDFDDTQILTVSEEINIGFITFNFIPYAKQEEEEEHNSINEFVEKDPNIWFSSNKGIILN